MTADDRHEMFNELMRLLPRISIEQPALMDSLEVLSRLLEAASSGEDFEQDELLLRALTDSSSQGRALAAGLLSLRMGLYARLERQACLDLALAGALGLSDVRRLAEERIHRPMGKSLRAEVLYLLQCRDERLDGSGPMGLSGKELDTPVGILATACAYVDRLAQGWSGLRALTFIYGERSLFHEGSAELLVQALSVFPIGSYVGLDSGEKGRVVGARPEDPLRPIVCVRLRADGGVIEPPLLYDQENAPRIASLLAEPWAGVPGPGETGPAWLQGLHERLSSWPQETGQLFPEILSGDWGRPSSESARRQEESARQQHQRLSAIQADIEQSKSALAALLTAIDFQRQKLSRMEEAHSQSQEVLRRQLEKKRAYYQGGNEKIKKHVETLAAEMQQLKRERERQLLVIQAAIERSKTTLSNLLEVEVRREEEGRTALLNLRRETAAELRRFRADPKLREIRLRLAAQQKRLEGQIKMAAEGAAVLRQEKTAERQACEKAVDLQRRKLRQMKEEFERRLAKHREVARLRIQTGYARHWNRIELLEKQIQAVVIETERERRLLAQLKGPVEALEKAAAPPAGAEEETACDPRLAAIQSDIDKAKAALAALIEAGRRQADDEKAALLRLRREAAAELRRLRSQAAHLIDEAKLRLIEAEEQLEAQREAFAQALEKGRRAISAREERWGIEKKSLESSLLEKRRELEDLHRAILEAGQRRDETAAAARRASAEFEQKAATLLASAKSRLTARRSALKDNLSSLKAETEQAGSQHAEVLEAFQKRRDCLEDEIRRLRGEWGDLQGVLGANEAEESALRQALKTALSELDLRLLEARFALDTARKETSALSQEQERRLKDWERAGRELEVLAQQYEKLSGETEPLFEQWRELSGRGLGGVSAVFREQILSRASELGLWSGRLLEVDRRLRASRSALEAHIFLRCREAGLRAFQEGRLDEARANLRRALSIKSDDETQSLLARLEGLPERTPEKEEPGP